MSFKILSLIAIAVISNYYADTTSAEVGSGAVKFAQLEQTLPTPTVYRTASGSPGPLYWQQQADYKINVFLDPEQRSIKGSETIVYTNNSPHHLNYIWLQLDQNRFKKNSLENRSITESGKDRLSFDRLRKMQSMSDRSHGFKLTAVTDQNNKALSYTIVDTMMRLDLPEPLIKGKRTHININWEFNIIEEAALGGRSGYEQFDTNKTQIFFLAQWYPRLAAYTDYAGWQHKAFLGRGEFTLEFGNFDVSITVPDNHVVSATGRLTNPKEVLSADQRKRFAAISADQPSFIITPEEARINESLESSGSKTWRFKAERVRDFAWASSTKFIWDAMLHLQPGAKFDKVLAMSFYPNEAQPIWSRYSTHAVAHTMDVYSRFSFDYPYPTAQSVNTWESGGMEYPMITFNGYRPAKPEDKISIDGSDPEETESTEELEQEIGEITYSRRTKYGLIGVIIHEIGHFYFPMIVNSDERQWTWMDEGLNTFLEYVAELEWEENFPAFNRDQTNVLDYIPEYMTSTRQVPIMTQSDSILQFGPNAYSKPAAALTVLRETIMGRELFDFAFREYSNRWKFKRPTPADFFRTMEDASGIDLDWFWRGWFYTTEHVDLGISQIRTYRIKTNDPDKDFALNRTKKAGDEPAPISEQRNREQGIIPRAERFPELRDFYNDNDPHTVTNKDRNQYSKFLDNLEDWESQAFNRVLREDPYLYFIDFKNTGGLISPIPLSIYYADGSKKESMLPAEIWRRDADEVTFLMVEDKPIDAIAIDEKHQIGDADFDNNRYPPEIKPSRLSVYKGKNKKKNLMADMLVKLKSKRKDGEDQSDSVPLDNGN
ncbi:MAG TPA: M1 family peptidase [Gammaproteobacteria bacterium]|nr:M1 family peptidase [Gammaproteobacteria bacterium]HIK69808.1 M1 family peptidase [Pseudomonadales bacterium]